MSKPQDYLRLMRPHQYLKNGFVLLGVVFSHQWGPSSLLGSALAFMAFCAMASTVYIMNDLMDVEADKQHPIKCARPLPSGQIKPAHALLLSLGLFSVSVAFALVVSTSVLACVLAYFMLNVLYSRWLKHVVILDVFVISSGFMLRILAGTIGLGIAPSEWLLLCGLMVTLFLGFAKRRAELLMLEAAETELTGTRKVLDEYSPALLEQLTSVTAACTLISYGLYTVSPQTIALHGSTALIYTMPFVTYGIFRYLFLLHHKSRGNDTAKDLMTDKHLLLTIAGWVFTILSILA
jgi:4-hydroxybenzoate polyprenyltransferase